MSTKRKIKTSKKTKKKKIIAILTSAVLVISVAVAVIAGNASSGGRMDFRFNGKVACGIDVSHHNGKIEWDKVSKEVDFAFIRAGYRGYSNGDIFSDKKFKSNIKNANANSVPVGIYFYSQAVTEEEAEEEAEFVIKAVRKYDISLPIAIDYEYAYNSKGKLTGRLYEANLTKGDTAKIINAFLGKIEEAGYKPAVYASTYFYNSVIETKKLSKSAFIWVADYNKELTYKGKYDMWQYSEKGKCNGVSSKYVDLNYYFMKEETE